MLREQWIVDRIGPTVRRALARRCPEQAELLYGIAVVRVLVRLRDHDQVSENRPIHNLEAYAAAVAENTAEQAIRNQDPERVLLRRRLRYCLENTPSFALWKQEGRLLCGYIHLRENKEMHLSHDLHLEVPKDLGAACAILFELSAGPIAFDTAVVLLTKALTQSRAEWGETNLEESQGHSVFGFESEGMGQPESTVVDQEQLKWLWQEVRSLPDRQRIALLLNLRDNRGKGVIELLLPMVSQEEVMAMVGLQAEDVGLWDRLPVEDVVIAQRLGVSRQQVINLRKVARERLARHLNRSGFLWLSLG